MGSNEFATADKFGKNDWPFQSLVLEFGSVSRLDLAP